MLLALLAACSSPPRGGRPLEHPTGAPDSGAPEQTCEDLQPRRLRLCAESDAPQIPDLDWDSPLGPVRYEGTAEVIAIGDGELLGPVAGGTLLNGFWVDCEDTKLQVQLRDTEGYTWLLGWTLNHPDSLSGLSVGAEVDFVVAAASSGFSIFSNGFALSDEAGPLLLAEDGGVLTPDDRGGLDLRFDRERECTQGYYLHHDLATLSWSGGAIGMRSGQSTTVPAEPGPRSLFFLLAAAHRFVESDWQIGCDDYQWIGWPDTAR